MVISADTAREAEKGGVSFDARLSFFCSRHPPPDRL
jgi:hypothetical protein